MSNSVDTRARARLAGVMLAVGAACLVAGAANAQATFGFGRAATPQEIDGWDIDVRPDGHGIRKGRGTVAQGQDLYDAQCAVCHGTFGESNNYLVIAGGVTPEDLKTGRAAALTRGEVRTVGTKLSHATTLWDYIRRAMPWTNPQSLTVDQVYAVTAYVLHLNEIVPAAFELSDQNLLKVQMPNRKGMTTAHGMGSVRGRPDVQGTLCMKDCVQETKVSSELPDFARNAHGNLAEQKRPLGPTRGIDTTRYDPSAKKTVAAAAPAATVAVAKAGPVAMDVLKKHACIACHATASKLVGPAYVEVGTKYAKRPDATAYLVGKMKSGGVGVWGQIPMPPQPNLTDAEAKSVASWILAGAK